MALTAGSGGATATIGATADVESNVTSSLEAALEARFAEIRALVVADRKQLAWESGRPLRQEIATLREQLHALGQTDGPCESRCGHEDQLATRESRGGGCQAPSLGEHWAVPDAPTEKLAAPCDVDELAQKSAWRGRLERRLQTEAVHNAPPTLDCASSEQPMPLSCITPTSGIGHVTSPKRPHTPSGHHYMADSGARHSAIHLKELVEAAKKLAEKDALRKAPSGEPVDVPLSALRFVDSVIDPLVSAIIIVNSVMIGLSIDVHRHWQGWLWLDVGFTAIYVLEAAFKMFVLGVKGFFFGPSAYWNRFDFAVIIMGVVDTGLSFAYITAGEESSSTPSLVLLRILRLTRIGRVLRLIHFKVFKELFTMLNGLVSGLRTLIWAFVILLFPIYTMSLMLTQFLGHSMTSDALIQEHFASLGTSMLMVFRCSVGDCSYGNGTPVIMHLVSEYGWVYGVGYILGTMLVTFGIFNLIMATFVDNALAAARHNELLRMQTRLSDMDRQARIVSEFIERLWICLHPNMDLKEFSVAEAMSMTLAAEDFDRIIEDPDIQSILEELDVPEDDRRALFDVLDADGGGQLEMEELIKGIIKLRGDPRRSDVVHVGLVLRSLQEEFRNFRLWTMPMLDKIASQDRTAVYV
eukprot:TRINITY_DN22216_c0_g1_i1.p1 TRINITY_DN22216_c0_g1~~TRINITY_DN22216_c0_g1_i1.p1  ORF type:complete len:676 (-),score=131.29 TRINITY_DN22216_c0_g1_i1:134-2050(-)